MWSVRVLSGAQAGEVYELKLGKNILGRGGQSDLKVQSLGISKEHCEVHMYKDKMMIVDLKSSNGTFVNGVKIQNSIVRVGDKISLFDIILDVIPTQDLRPRPAPVSQRSQDLPQYSLPENLNPDAKKSKKKKRRFQSPAVYGNSAGGPNYPAMGNRGYSNQQGNLALQMGYPQQTPLYQVPPLDSNAAQTAPTMQLHQSFSEKFDYFMENKVMPAIYSLVSIFSFRQVLQAFILIFVFAVTIMSVVPLTNIIREANMKEAYKRAGSVARALAKFNEQALLNGQFNNLTVTEALKEEGIKEALIIQQSDGLVVAPPEKAGRDEPITIVLTARKETRPVFEKIDEQTIGATFPIAVYDPSSGDALPKYHAVVKYDISSLNIDENRIVSLFMQTLIVASVFGLILFQLFARVIEFPVRTLNAQIDRALIDKTDRTEVDFDYPAFQKLISNVNTILNRAWSGESGQMIKKPQQNKENEFINLVEIIAHPALVISQQKLIVAANTNFEQLLQITRESILNQPYQNLTDSSLVQNIESLLARSQQTPFEKHSDRIPFSQFECEIHCQVFVDTDGQPDYYILTLVQVAGA